MSSSSSSSEERNDGDPNAFVSSMTFASGAVTRNCDCDECGFGLIPLSIASAIRQHKKRRISSALTRTQDRSLVCRQNDVSVWKLTMPLDAEPLIEFGNSHRIVFIDTLSSQSNLVSIGKGIIGSSDEEKSRVKVDWKQGMAYLVPPNRGKAIGWVHSTNNDARNDPIIGHAILYTIKIPPKVLLVESNSDAKQEWMQCAIATLHHNAHALSNGMETRTDKPDTALKPWVQLSKGDSFVVRNMIHELLESKE